MKFSALLAAATLFTSAPVFAQSSVCDSFKAAKAEHQQRYLATKNSNPTQAAESYKAIVRINGKLQQFGCN